jgi:hypothetical protein
MGFFYLYGIAAVKGHDGSVATPCRLHQRWFRVSGSPTMPDFGVVGVICPMALRRPPLPEQTMGSFLLLSGNRLMPVLIAGWL